MRPLFALIFLTLSQISVAAPADYEIYVLICDTSDCQHVLNAKLESDGSHAEYRATNISLKLDILSAKVGESEVRLTADISPELGSPVTRDVARPRPGKVSIAVEPRTVRYGQYSSLASVSTGNRVYQLWGRIAASSAVAGKVALR
jgi:hypothetical protein